MPYTNFSVRFMHDVIDYLAAIFDTEQHAWLCAKTLMCMSDLDIM
jgi:hypothetical protein